MAQASTVVAERERFPGVSLSGGMFWTSDPFGATYSLGVAVELPILDSRGGALDRARAEADAASLRRRLVEAEIEADVALYAVQVAQRASALQHFQRQVEPRLSGLRQMAEDAYRLGRSSIIELLDALRTRHETQTGHLELVAGLVEAQLRLRAARGEFAARSNGS